ncbi:permease [Parendozoicomonas haliclonae]|uniref:Putative permease n=1 Tax=Parendozoicomonas haliclonae TaxID=1960125 RepID=A0A1X7ANE6_9GAMM|nr:permease [Parendozoicomonas haliclonae]SMA49841.1 putative permease [Parendozoicomonas haliclonae]
MFWYNYDLYCGLPLSMIMRWSLCMLFVEILSSYAFLLWHMIWPITLGFILAGGVRSYVPTQTIVHRLGSSRSDAGLLAAGFGFVSSICNYATISAGHSLVLKGASWPNVLVCMLASTNLGITILIAIAGFLGGAFLSVQIVTGLICLLVVYLLSPLFRLGKNTPKAEKGDGMMMNQSRWQDACDYLRGDLDMTRKDILVGLLIAACISVLVPASAWTLFFETGPVTPFAALWNVVVGSLIAILTFGCSIGNVTVAAVMWWQGVPVAGVMAYLLSGLLTIPMLKVSYRYYGGGLTVRLAGAIWISIAIACLITELGLSYWPIKLAHTHMTPMAAHVDLTLILNVLIGGLGAVMYRRGQPMDM